MIQATRRHNWQQRVRNVLRSRHYQWLAECRDGDPVEEVIKDVATDLMHLCREKGLTWEQVIEESRRQFEAEARELAKKAN